MRDDACRDCMGVPNGLSEKDACGVCYEPADQLVNTTCADCAGVPNGLSIIDACGACKEPTDPTFSQGCLGCDGIPDSGKVVDACGICGGDDSTCEDCNGTPNGGAVLDGCGVCGGNGASCSDCKWIPNGNHTVDACGVCLLPGDAARNESCKDCAGVINGNSIVDPCGLCLPVDDPAFGTSCADCAGVPNGNSIVDLCGDCKNPTDNSTGTGFNEACKDCAGVVNGPKIVDPCGECKDPFIDATFGQGCAGCDGVPNSGFTLDTCNLCLSPTDPVRDTLCIDCEGVAFGNKTFDECSVCLDPNDPEFNKACAGCDWVPNSGAELDACNVCGGDGQSCLDCMSEPFGNAENDACGVCGGDSLSCADCKWIPNGNNTLDACGVCLLPGDAERNQTCLGCDGIPNSGLVMDGCGVCGGNGSTCIGCDGLLYPNEAFRPSLDECGVCLLPNDPTRGKACEQCGDHCAFYEVKWAHGTRSVTLTAIELEAGQTPEEFYSYDNPIAFSPNTGLARPDGLVVFLVREPDTGEVSLFAHIDEANDGSNGQSYIRLTSDKMAGTGVAGIVADDPFDPDVYAWDDVTGTGDAYSVWGENGGDGFVIGKLPTTKDSCVRFSFPQDNEFGCSPNPQGLDSISFVTYNRINGETVVVDPVHPSISFFYGFEICRVCKCDSFDPCGLCLEPDAPEFGRQCEDCEGTPNGGKVVDACGVCGGDNSTCSDCLGVPLGTAVVDECGVCGGLGMSCADCSGEPNGERVLDACNVCRFPDDMAFNVSCLGCDGVPGSGFVVRSKRVERVRMYRVCFVVCVCFIFMFYFPFRCVCVCVFPSFRLTNLSNCFVSLHSLTLVVSVAATASRALTAWVSPTAAW